MFRWEMSTSDCILWHRMIVAIAYPVRLESILARIWFIFSLLCSDCLPVLILFLHASVTVYMAQFTSNFYSESSYACIHRRNVVQLLGFWLKSVRVCWSGTGSDATNLLQWLFRSSSVMMCSNKLSLQMILWWLICRIFVYFSLFVLVMLNC